MDAFALLVGEIWGGGFLDELLEPALHGAVAGASDDDVAVRIRQHLCFNVAGAVEVALHEALATAERCFGFAGGGLEQFADLATRAGDLHTAAATTVRRLDSHR